MGNFWRVKGDTQKAIECFRRALAVAPNNAEILLNLARVLFNLQYLDDAIFLTRRSLEVQPPDQNAWLQHFQLGEILKAYSHYQEAALHLRHVLELKPNYGPAVQALKVICQSKLTRYPEIYLYVHFTSGHGVTSGFISSFLHHHHYCVVGGRSLVLDSHHPRHLWWRQ